MQSACNAKPHQWFGAGSAAERAFLKRPPTDAERLFQAFVGDPPQPLSCVVVGATMLNISLSPLTRRLEEAEE